MVFLWNGRPKAQAVEKACHSEPVTDVTGVGIRPRARRRGNPHLPCVKGGQREALTEGLSLSGGAEPRPYTPSIDSVYAICADGCTPRVFVPFPFLCLQRPLAATYLCRFAAKARFDNRLNYGRGFPKGRGRDPSPFGRFKEGGFSRGKGNRNPFPLEWRFWLLLSLLTKVTRRRQKERNSKSKSRIFNRFLGIFFRERITPPEANKRIFSAPGRGTPVPHAK